MHPETLPLALHSPPAQPPHSLFPWQSLSQEQCPAMAGTSLHPCPATVLGWLGLFSPTHPIEQQHLLLCTFL